MAISSTQTIPLVAGTPIRLPGGKAFALLDSSSPVDITILGKNNGIIDKLEDITAYFMFKNIGDPLGFMGVILESSVNQTIQVGIFNYDVESYKPQEITETHEIGGSTLITATDTSIGATTKTQIVTANSTTKEVHLSALSTNVQEVRWGDTNIDATRGGLLYPGQTIVVTSSDDIFIYNSHGSTAHSVSALIIQK